MSMNIATIIKNARQTKYYITFSDAEFEYISSNELLSSNEKLIWLNLARKCHLDANMSCQLTHHQMSKMVGLSYDVVYRAIRNLKSKGFLEAKFEEAKQSNMYTLLLPQEGIDAIHNAPNRKGKDQAYKGPCVSADTLPEIHPVSTCYPADTLPAGNPILLIKNNNNKNNNKNRVDEHQSLHPEKNHENLICDYLNLLNKYSSYSFRERMKHLHAHFSENDLKAIHLILVERQRKSEIVTDPKIEESQPNVATKQTSCESYRDLIFDGNHYLIEEKVKDKIFNQIPTLYENQIKNGSLKNKNLSNLITEILYFATKMNISSKKVGAAKSISQIHKFNIARKKLLEGTWETPYQMVAVESLKRETKWKEDKQIENQRSREFMKSLGMR